MQPDCKKQDNGSAHDLTFLEWWGQAHTRYNTNLAEGQEEALRKAPPFHPRKPIKGEPPSDASSGWTDNNTFS